MVRRLLLLTIILFLSQITVAFSQISTPTVDVGPYTAGSTVSATFNLGSTTCIRPGSQFELFLSDASGNFGSEVRIGTFNGFYSTFVNGVIPVGTPAGTGYRVRVKSTNPVLVSAQSAAFEIRAGAAVSAQVSSGPVIGTDMFGFCPGRDNYAYTFSNQSTATSSVTATITNELTGAVASTLTFAPPTQPQQFTASLAHYTVFVKAQMPDGSVATRAYMLVNNNVFNSFSTTGSNVVCLPGGFLQYGVDVSATGILNNYPGNTYEIIWGDGVTDTYTFCDLKSGFVRHEYLRPSCGNPPYSTGGQTIYNVFGINISVISPCGPVGGAISTYVRVVTKPENRFSSPAAACTNTPVTFTNNSIAGQNPGSNTPACSDNNVLYNWYVNNVLMLANVPRSTDFVHTFTTHGVYDIKLESITNGVCEGVPVNHPICIQDPPQPAFDFGGAQLTGCAPFTVQAFDRSVVDAICNANNTYNWIVSPSAGVQFNPTDKNPIFTFTTPGTYTIILEIQTASCGAVRTQIPQQIVLADGAPVATLSADAVLCALNTFSFDNVTTGPTRTILTGTQQDIPNTTYTWYVTESDGTALAAGDFSFEGGTDLHTKYPRIKFNQFKTYRIRVVHTNSCGQTEDSQLITFSPSPVPDIAVSPNPICYNADVNLQGSITNGSYTSFQWIGNGGTFSAPLSLTTTYTPSPAERNAGTTTIRLVVNTGLQGTCAQVEDNVVVTILPNNTGTNATQQICSGTAAAHTPTSTVAGSTYSWTVSNPDGNASGQVAGSGTSITDLITNNSPTTDAVVIYTITPVSNGCTGVPYTFTVTVTPRPVITAVPARPTICSSESTNITLTSNLPNTTYTWTSTVTGTVTGNTSTSSTPIAATAINNTLINNGTAPGSVTYLITPYSAAGCAGTQVSVTINVDPAVTVANAGADRSICATNSYTLEALPATVGTGVWTQTSANTAPVTFANINDPHTVVTGLNPGEVYRFTWTISAPGVCAPTTDEVVITVNEPTIPGTTAGNPTIVCANNNTGTITLSGNTGNVIGWESSPDGTTWTTISGSNTSTTYTFNNLATATHFRAVVQNGGCTIERSSPTTISVSAGTTIANAGIGQTLCNATAVTLTANPPAAGETGLWTMVSGNVNAQITTPAAPQTTVTNLAPGVTYVFRWTITGNPPCGPTFSEVTVRNNDPVSNNTISTNTVVCNGQQVLIDGTVPTGGDGTYGYTWEMQENNGAWTVVPNATGEDLTITLTTSGTVGFRRNVASGGCASTSNEFPVTVQPPIANNSIAADQSICNGTASALLTGSIPTGGDGQFLYQWQSSPDGTAWTDIPGALAQSYQPPVLTQTTFYRRTVGTLACSGSFQNASVAVRITVNPNARAEFTWTTDTGCAPYALPIGTVPYPDRNATYTWYANNVVIPSTGSVFPGYTIANSNQSVTIKLVVTSSLGCAPAEFEHIFSTNQAVPAVFTPTSSTGCGPLQINFVNQSVQTAGARFRWNFGNGQTSTNTNPPTITFQPDASGKDTTYIVTLYSTTDCGIDSAKGTVLVKSGPKPVFSPSTTSGCSPLSVNFSNNSPLQTGIEYFFDFGDGTPVVRTTDRSTVTHIYRTTTNTQTFNATLTAVNECGTVTTLPYAIVVRPNTVNAELVVNGNQLRGCAPFSVTFDNNSTGATDFIVDFNDGSQPRQSIIFPERFVHTFTAPGTYAVTLTATNGCSTDATTETITVLPQPLTEFEADNTLGCPGLIVKFKNNTQNGVSYIWDFGDGSPISNEFEPTHTYSGTQEYYTVTLTATNNLGCTMTVTKNQYIHIVQPPVAAFNVNPSTLINIPDYTFSFEDESTNNPTIWEWDFGDGTGSALRNPSHTYLDTGTYRVTLRVMNQQGCFTSTFKNVTIKGVPGYLFVPNSFIPGDTKPELREFRAKGSGIATWRFSIFNKWGQLLWETTKLEEGRPVEGWDGTFKGQQLPQGVYYWKIDVQMVNGSEWKGMTYDSSAPRRTGPIHLIR